MPLTYLRIAADHVRRAAARSRTATQLALRLREHMSGVVAHRLGHDIDPTRNGEFWVLDRIAPSCKSFIDVGANVGEWSEAVLERSPRARGLVVEPSLDAVRSLRRLTNDRVVLVEAAAGAECGSAVFYEEPNAGRTSTLHASAARSTARPREVRVVAIDSLVAEQGWSTVDLLKIDAEGHDYQVLLGCRQLLAKHGIGLVQFEYNRSWQYSGSSIRDAESLFGAYGYEMLLLKGPRLFRFPYDVYGDFYSYANFVAISPRYQHAFPLARVRPI